MTPRWSRSVFSSGYVAGIAALVFNLVLRLGGLAAFPPESALGAFLRVIPASIEEPMVQQFGDFAGQLGLIVATLVGAAAYGFLAVIFDRFLSMRLKPLSGFERLLAFALVPWLLFGLLLFPLDGDSFFGSASAFASQSAAWTYPLTALLVQSLFALALSFKYSRPAPAAPLQPNASRREFIEKGAVGILAVVAGLIGLGGIGSLFPSQVQPTGGSQPIDLQDAPAIFRDPRLGSLVGSEVTPNDNFYRVAIDIIDLSVNASEWLLTVDGLVGSPKRYTLRELQALPQASQYTTFECVSNQINGNLVGNAKWTGVKLSDLFSDAGGAQAAAKYVVFYSVDGYSVGIPLSKAMMPDSIVAHSMNDQPLPVKHGYPLRGVIPGLYGMMSGKWVNRISAIDSAYQGYWQTRGWTNLATVNTVAFIVMPESGSQASISKNGGSIILAGYAFAGDRGISKVEVSFDGGQSWQQAQLKKPLSNLTWALWAYEWKPAGTGEKAVYVRATDGGGQAQTSTVSDTFPNGATGYAHVSVNVAN